MVDEVPLALGTITDSELEQEMLQLATLEGRKGRLDPAGDEYARLADQALESMIVSIWLRGQAEELGISINSRLVEKGLQGEEARALNEANFTKKTIGERVRMNLAAEGIMARLGERAEMPTDEEVRLYYEAEGLRKEGTFAELRSEIETQLREQKKQEVYSEVDIRFPVEWQPRTHCAEDFVLEQCADFPGFGHFSWMPRACWEEDASPPADDCPAPVTGRYVAMPGTIRPWRPEGDKRVQGPAPSGGWAAEPSE